jgi:hypothetical protein
VKVYHLSKTYACTTELVNKSIRQYAGPAVRPHLRIVVPSYAFNEIC